MLPASHKNKTAGKRGSGRGRKRRPARESAEWQHQVPPSMATPKRVFVLCHYCSYSPSEEVPVTGVCPKCGGHSWERFALSVKLLAQGSAPTTG